MKISVIIPTYNRATTIERCINSVLNQTKPVFEIIIVDDCSVDDTREIVSGLSDSRIKLLKHKTNKGAQEARNTGIKSAKGDWIAFLDSDDTWEKYKIQKQVHILTSESWNPYVVIHTDGYFKENKSNLRELYKIPEINGKTAYQSLLKQPGPAFPTILCSKLVLEEIGCLDTKVLTHQEWDISIRLAQRCKFYHIKEPLFTWYINGGETISSNGLNHVKGYEYIIRKFEKEIKGLDHGEWWDNHLKALITKKIKVGLYKEAKELLAEFINPESLHYFSSKIMLRLKLKQDLSLSNSFVRILYRAWNLKHNFG